MKNISFTHPHETSSDSSVRPHGEFPTVDEDASPCINACQLDGDGICMGCYRSIDEIQKWPSMSRENRIKVLRDIVARQQN
ncbi:MAG: hypothetical protein DHS20C01_26620 [marine bacterium B5-7]|nr:MAG: hypothetical protein DHS20C01_26620 [marine bacterium B5-7]